MKRKIILSTLILLPILIGVIVIFYFSSQDGYESTSLSHKFTRKLSEIIFINFNIFSIDIQNLITSELNIFVRKVAHFTVFLFMNFFVYAELVLWINKYFISGVISTAICLLYAIFDEYHQSFIPQRTPLVSDILIDTLGALIGALICFSFISVIKHIKIIMQKNNSSQPFANL